MDRPCRPPAGRAASSASTRSPTTSSLLRVGRRAAAAAGAPQRRHAVRDRSARGRVRARRRRHEPRVRHATFRFTLPVARHAAVGVRRRPRHRRARRCSSRQPVLGGFDAGQYETRPHVGHGEPTAPRCRSHSSRRRAGRATAATRRCSTATAPTSRSMRAVVLVGRGCRCSTAASSSPSPTSAAAASSAGAGTSTASSSHKRNTFTDFVACAEHLVAEGWTSAGPPGDPRRQRRRAARGRGDEPATRPLRRASWPRCRSSTSSTTMLDDRCRSRSRSGRSGATPTTSRVRRATCRRTRPTRTSPRRRTRAIFATRGLQRPPRELPRAGEVGRALCARPPPGRSRCC